MAIEVFNRCENKYLLDERKYLLLRGKLENICDVDAYNKTRDTYSIGNLYYDTADSYLIRTSISKPRYKEKIRLRAYGIPEPNAKIYVEIKKKVKGLVNKRRTALLLKNAYNFLETAQLPEAQNANTQVLSEIQYIAKTQILRPAAYLAYDRRAYFGSDDLRISFDCNIRSRRYDLRLEAGDYGEQLLGKGQYLMEIKVARAIPLWLCKLLSELEIYPQSFSKYGAEYKKWNTKNNVGGEKCSTLYFPERPKLLQSA
jgi:hypothetical protein